MELNNGDRVGSENQKNPSGIILFCVILRFLKPNFV